MPSINNLATTPALTAVENKITSVSNLIKKADYNTKIDEIENKTVNYSYDRYITTPEFNKRTAENSAARLKKENLVTKTDFDNKLKNLNKKINPNKTKHLIVENELRN